MSFNVTKLQVPQPPKRCEFPECRTRDETVGYVKLFGKHMCPHHRKDMLLAKSWLMQIEDEARIATGNLGILETLEHVTKKRNLVYAVDKETMDRVKGVMTEMERQLQEYKDRENAARTPGQDPSIH